MKRLFVLLFLCLMSTPLLAQSVYYATNVDHDTNIVDAANKLAGTIGGTATGFDAGVDADWTSAALPNADIIFVGQGSEVYNLAGATLAAIGAWVSNGGSLVVLRDQTNLDLLNSVLGTSMTLGQSGSSGNTYDSTKQPDVTGTSFDSAPAVLSSDVNDWRAINAASMSGGIPAYIDDFGNIHVMVQPFGAGTVAYLAFDWCCGFDQQELDDWDAALLSSATFVGDSVVGTAYFRVTKSYTDGSVADIEVTLTCNAGFELVQSFTLDGGENSVVTFTVTELTEDVAADCVITETGGIANYEPVMNGGAGCSWTGVTGGTRYCSIVNTPADAEYIITKEWVLGDNQFELDDYDAEISVVCLSDIVSVGTYSHYGSSTTVVLRDGESVGLMVDVSQGDTMCSASEVDVFAGVETSFSDDCSDAELGAGESAECVITNTLFFEGIPTLNQYGLALMALLMLGVGVIGFRRFV